MTEHDASPQQHLLPRPHHHRSTSRDRHASPVSPGTGDSSTSGSLMNSTWTTDATPIQRPSHDGATTSGQAGERHRRGDGAREDNRHSRRPRSHRRRFSGTFLLHDPFDEAVLDEGRPHKHRSGRTIDKSKGKSKVQRTSTRHSDDEHIHNGRHPSLGLALSPGLARMGNGSAGKAPGSSPGALSSESRQNQLQKSPRLPSPRSSTSSLDMDSTQIVNMALNLSESRRMAQRRNLSQPLPPRLVPLVTDNTVAGSLKQQLQQQRRVSRTMSPKSDRGGMSRLGSSGKISSLQPAFDAIKNDGSYRYQFSNSTMARAQKAKDYMELFAQYRRVLELLPPLKPNTLSKTSTSSDYPHSVGSMPVSLNNFDAASQIGRPYDPLQYIRNRKVRARERKTIDGESQGFGDVCRVTDWVDDVAKWVATRQMRTPGSSALPPFAGADMSSKETSPPSHLSRPSNTITKPKRPRNDWTIEPADLMADIYWLEQDDHKRLLEDRNWRRVFPQDSELYRPLSRATIDASPAVASKSAQLQLSGAEDGPGKSAAEAKAAKVDHDHTPGGTRERARQKLQELRSFHRHTNSSHGHSHNLLRRRDSSSSSSSDPDSQRKRSRKNTIDIDKDILEKQMMEMIAREVHESGSKSSQEPERNALRSRPSNIMAPDRLDNSDSTGGSRQQSRRESLVNVASVDDKEQASRSKMISSQRPSRESLEVPPFWGRTSMESESSPPNSPEARTSRRDNYFMPGIGADLSPSSSRAGSPSRNPFSKVKHMFRDRSKERASDRQQDTHTNEKDDSFEVVTAPLDRLSSAPDLLGNRGSSRSRTGSVGPEPKIKSRQTGDSQRSHRKTNSIRFDASAGLRSLFKGPRIDSVIKSGVSKVSELLWKKESEAEDSDSSTSSSDGTDAEDRGRRKGSRSISPSGSIRGRPAVVKQESKHFLDVMPPFFPASDVRENADLHLSSGTSLSRPASSRSTRFELLRPPRIDISVAGDSLVGKQKDQTADITDSETRMSKIHEPTIGDAQRGTAWSVQSPKTCRFSMAFSRDGRRFSASGQSFATERAPLTRREMARLKALMLSSGVMAMNIYRRAHQSEVLDTTTAVESNNVLAALGNRISLPEIIQLAPEDQRHELLSRPISEVDLFPVTARILGTAIQTSRQQWESAAESFKHRARSDINGQIEQLRTRLQLDLSAMTRTAAEEADEVSGDLVDGQRRKVKAVVDVIDKLSRRRQRRFRWVRRAGWLALEWALVGFMWYVWLVVMIARVFLGVGKGCVRGVRWLLWL